MPQPGAACDTAASASAAAMQPARHLDLRRRGLALADQAGGVVAPNLVQLIAVDVDVAARAQRRSRRDSGQSTAKIAAAVISASTNQSVMASFHQAESGIPEATCHLARCDHRPRSYITAAAAPQPGRLRRAGFRPSPGQPCARHSSAGLRRLHQQRGIVLAERLAAEFDRGVHLRLPERAIVLAGDAQRIEQRARAAVEILLDLLERRAASLR